MTGKVISMFLSRHRKQPQIAPVYHGIPRSEAVVCDECNTTTKAINARCGTCKSEAITWISAFVPGRPEPPDPPAAQVLPIPVPDTQEEDTSLFPDFLQLVFRLVKPPAHPHRKPAFNWEIWTEEQNSLKAKLAIPTLIRERASFRSHTAA